jgi:thymidylate synthase ThyX
MISAKIVADSISQEGIRLTTFQLRYPRFIHAECRTHRVMSQTGEDLEVISTDMGLMVDRDLSRNARSSRAVPVKTMLDEVRNNPVMPVYWGKNISGMQAKEELTGKALEEAKLCWLASAKSALHYAERMAEIGLHKQIANRILEPYMYIDTLVTGTELANFFALRRHPDAQPEIQELANLMWEARQTSTPDLLQPGEWHLPYVTKEERQTYPLDVLQKLSSARNARISYKPFDGNASLEAELERFDRLAGGAPLHASPMEHIATPDVKNWGNEWCNPHLHGNLRGFIQFRKLLPNENITEYAA